jgi:hypothetical protein
MTLRAHPHFLLVRACNSLSLRPVRKREKKRKRERKRESEKEGERDVEYGCFVFIFEGITGALAPFSYLV